MQINQLLLLVVLFVLSFELMLGSWIHGWNRGIFFLLLCYSPWAVGFVFVFASLRLRYSYVIKIHRIHYHFLNLIFIGLYHATTTTTTTTITKAVGGKPKRDREIYVAREGKNQRQRKTIALHNNEKRSEFHILLLNDIQLLEWLAEVNDVNDVHQF